MVYSKYLIITDTLRKHEYEIYNTSDDLVGHMNLKWSKVGQTVIRQYFTQIDIFNKHQQRQNTYIQCSV